VGGSQPVAIPWVEALGFLRVMTRRVALQQPMEMALALAIEHQAVVHFNDSDFSRFPGLRWSNPLL
jgi:predicted nucleic acid-binding protein